MEIRVVAPRETRNRYVPYDPAIPGHRPRTLYILTERQVPIHVHCCSIHNSQHVEAAQMSICWWRHKENAVPGHNGSLLSREEKWNLQENAGNRKVKQPRPEWQIPHIFTHARLLPSADPSDSYLLTLGNWKGKIDHLGGVWNTDNTERKGGNREGLSGERDGRTGQRRKLTGWKTNIKDVWKSHTETYFIKHTRAHMCTHIHTHIHTQRTLHIKEFNWSYPTEQVMFLPESTGGQIKGHRYGIHPRQLITDILEIH